jgi:hypothetical protein
MTNRGSSWPRAGWPEEFWPEIESLPKMKNEKPNTTANDARATATNECGSRMLNELVTGDFPLWARYPRQIMAITLLMAAKLGDKKVLKDDSLIRAKMAAGSVKSTGSLGAVLYLIVLAVVTNDKKFFIDFGKCLSGDIKDPHCSTNATSTSRTSFCLTLRCRQGRQCANCIGAAIMALLRTISECGR